MSIINLGIENFKGISDKVEFFSRNNILLFGANDSVKSTTFQSLLYLRKLFEGEKVDSDRMRVGGEVIRLGGFCRFLCKREFERRVTDCFHSSGERRAAPALSS